MQIPPKFDLVEYLKESLVPDSELPAELFPHLIPVTSTQLLEITELRPTIAACIDDLQTSMADYACITFAEDGLLQFLRCAHEDYGFSLYNDDDTSFHNDPDTAIGNSAYAAAKFGQLECLTYIHGTNHCPIDPTQLCRWATFGNVRTLEFALTLVSLNPPLLLELVWYAVLFDNCDCLRHLVSYGGESFLNEVNAYDDKYPYMNIKYTLLCLAAKQNNVELMNCIYDCCDNGTLGRVYHYPRPSYSYHRPTFSWTNVSGIHDVLLVAAKYGYIDCFRTAYEKCGNNIQKRLRACKAINDTTIRYGHSELLNYIHQLGFAWTYSPCALAIYRKHVQCYAMVKLLAPLCSSSSKSKSSKHRTWETDCPALPIVLECRCWHAGEKCCRMFWGGHTSRTLSRD